MASGSDKLSFKGALCHGKACGRSPQAAMHLGPYKGGKGGVKPQVSGHVDRGQLGNNPNAYDLGNRGPFTKAGKGRKK